MKVKFKTYNIAGKEKNYIILSDRNRRSIVRRIPGIPLEAYKRRFKQGSRKSISNFVTRPVVIRKNNKSYVVGLGKTIRVKEGLETDVKKYKRALKITKGQRASQKRISNIAKTLTKGKQIEKQKLLEKLKKYKDMVAVFGSKDKFLDLGVFLNKNLNSLGVYNKVALKMRENPNELLKIIVGNKSKINSRMQYIVEFRDMAGNMMVAEKCRGIDIDKLRRWINSIIVLAGNGKISSNEKLYDQGAKLTKKSHINQLGDGWRINGMQLNATIKIGFKNVW